MGIKDFIFVSKMRLLFQVLENKWILDWYTQNFRHSVEKEFSFYFIRVKVNCNDDVWVLHLSSSSSSFILILCICERLSFTINTLNNFVKEKRTTRNEYILTRDKDILSIIWSHYFIFNHAHYYKAQFVKKNF